MDGQKEGKRERGREGNLISGWLAGQRADKFSRSQVTESLEAQDLKTLMTQERRWRVVFQPKANLTQIKTEKNFKLLYLSCNICLSCLTKVDLNTATMLYIHITIKRN